MAQHVSVRTDNIRPDYEDFRDWSAEEGNLYVGRGMRIFVWDGEYLDNGKKKMVYYRIPESKWGNPYKVGKGKGKYSLEKSLDLYREHLVESGLIDDIDELQGMNLGCYCKPGDPCHAKVLAELVNELD